MPVNRDHVFAKTLWNEPAKTPVIIPACEECHDAKGVCESSLRDYLVIDERGTVGASDEQLNKAFRSMARGSSMYSELLQKALRTPASKETIEIDFSRVNIAVLYIVRGLHYAMTGLPFPENEPMFPTVLGPDDIPTLHDFFESIDIAERGELGASGTRWIMLPPEPGVASDKTTWWLLCFWDKVYFFVLAGQNAKSHADRMDSQAMHRTTSIREIIGL
jgi:hypothetical protein